MRAIEIIKASIGSHQSWIDYIKAHLDFQGETHGDSEFHQNRIDDYNVTIKEIKQLKAEIRVKTEILDELGLGSNFEKRINDFQQLKAEKKWLQEGIELALEYLLDSPNKAESFLRGALRGKQ